MQVEFVERDNGPERLVCDAEIVFEESSPLAGMKLVGFSLWKGADGQLLVTFPARSFGAGAERRFFDYLRPMRSGSPELARRIKDWITEQYRLRRAA
jgi:hypothetical protein